MDLTIQHFGESNKERLDILLKGVNYILGHEEEEKKILFVRQLLLVSLKLCQKSLVGRK